MKEINGTTYTGDYKRQQQISSIPYSQSACRLLYEYCKANKSRRQMSRGWFDGFAHVKRQQRHCTD